MKAKQPIKELYHITVPYGVNYIFGRHKGVDFRTKTKEHPNGIGTPIRAIAGGRWLGVFYNRIFGKHVKLIHDNDYVSIYGHLSESTYKEGYKDIRMGDIVGFSGNTGMSLGPHLHLQVEKDEVPVDPIELIETGNRLKHWARARGIMRVEGRGEISFLVKDKLINLNKENCWDVLKNNTWGISENDYKDLENLIK